MDTVTAFTNADLWAAIVAFFLPLVIALVVQSNWSSRIKSLVAFGAAMVVGVVTAWLNGQFEGVDVVRAILIAFVVSISAYQALWKPTGTSPRIEAATTADGP